MLNKELYPQWKNNMENKLAGTLKTLFFSKQAKTINFIVINTVKTWRILCKTIKVKDRFELS